MDDTLALIEMEDDLSMMEIERVGDGGVGLTLYMEGEVSCIYIPFAKLPDVIAVLQGAARAFVIG